MGMRKCAVYRAIAIVHAQQAATSRSDGICEEHVRLAASFLTLANSEAMRHLKAGAQLSLNALTGEPAREVISVRCLGKPPADDLSVISSLMAAVPALNAASAMEVVKASSARPNPPEGNASSTMWE
jgi:hypothetical protein